MDSNFISHPISGGHTWTITSKLGHMLSAAEKKYGPRDTSYTILGIEYNQVSQPCVWYPSGDKHVVIQITLECINNLDRAVFQVAHELIHCLSPTRTNVVNVLEEGIATLFSIEYTYANGNGNWFPTIQKYNDAVALVEQLLSFDIDIIKKIRQVQPTISYIDRDLILRINPAIPEHLADNLTRPF